MEEELRLSVRELVAFCFPPEDLTPGGGLEDMLAGGRAHRARQQRQTGKAECSVEHVFAPGQERVRLFGRMDAFTDGEVPYVEEIKLSAWQGEDVMPEHRAQAVCYGAMVAAKQECERVTVCVSYVNEQGEVLRCFEETLTAAALLNEVRQWLERWLAFALRERAHRALRNQSIQALVFPYERYRAGQRELAAQVYTAISRKKRLFASLPTGTGKSAAVLFPALKAMGEGKTEKLVYLTARNTARQSPLQALERMKAQGLQARVSVLTAKEKLCPNRVRCHPDECPRAKGYYLREPLAEQELLEGSAPIWTDEVITEAAEKHGICPLELALRMSEMADVALMDVNYAFDPFAKVKRLHQRRQGTTLLIDEAHHLLDRVRESLSGEMDSGVLRDYRTLIGKQAGRKHPLYLALTQTLKALRGLEPAQGGTPGELPALPQEVLEAVESLCQTVSQTTVAPNGASLPDVFALLRLCLPFLYAAEHLDEDYAILLEPHGKERALCLYCLLPGKEIAQVTKPMKGTVFFSATLSPLPAMKQLLGGGEEDACFALPSPFPPERLAVVRKPISTKYGDREQSAAAVAECITRAANARRGNYIAYFPSYAYLELVLSHLQPEELPPLWVQRRDMTEEDRADFFAAFSDEGAPRLGLCVLGGLFSEGIDLPGERLIGVIIVGVGLPTPSPKLRAIQRCYQTHFGDGFGYACRIPAMQKVLQAGGRVIRSETDKGLLVLLDSRYNEREYEELLPLEWRQRQDDLDKAAEEVWKEE